MIRQLVEMLDIIEDAFSEAYGFECKIFSVMGFVSTSATIKTVLNERGYSVAIK